MSDIRDTPIFTDWATGRVIGAPMVEARRTIGELKGLFLDEPARLALPQDQLAYRTECWFPAKDGQEAGLWWGTTFIEPGLVGDEYFMTKGHFHAKPDRMEFYFTFAGDGLLLYMDRDRRCWAERMRPGSTHAIPAHVAHRTINTGSTVLSFGAC